MLFGFRYIFESAGDGLPEHAHGPELEHDVFVMRGRVAVITADGVEVLKPRTACPRRSWQTPAFVFDSSVAHRIIALEAAEIINKIHRGLPAGYARLTDAELSGEIEAPIDFYLEGI